MATSVMKRMQHGGSATAKKGDMATATNSKTHPSCLAKAPTPPCLDMAEYNVNAPASRSSVQEGIRPEMPCVAMNLRSSASTFLRSFQ